MQRGGYLDGRGWITIRKTDRRKEIGRGNKTEREREENERQGEKDRYKCTKRLR